MSLSNFVSSLKSNINASISDHRNLLGSMNHVLELNSRFSFIQALEEVNKLVDKLSEAHSVGDAVQAVADSAASVVEAVVAPESDAQ